MKQRGTTLAEVLVAAGLLSLVTMAVMSFYIEAVAVSAKKDEQSTRLRRFHLGLDKIEQTLRQGSVTQLGYRFITFLSLNEDNPELNGFPNFNPAPSQFVSTEQGVVLLESGKEIPVLPTEEGEHVLFTWMPEEPSASPPEPKETLVNVALYYSGQGKRSELFFHRTINLIKY